jgi:hypothetical protein
MLLASRNTLLQVHRAQEAARETLQMIAESPALAPGSAMDLILVDETNI